MAILKTTHIPTESPFLLRAAISARLDWISGPEYAPSSLHRGIKPAQPGFYNRTQFRP